MSDILNSAHNMNIGESIFFEVNNGTKLVQTPTGYQSTKVPLEIKRGDDGLYTLHLYTGEADSNNKDDVWTQRMANKPIDITDNEWAVLSGQMKFVSPTDAYMYSIKYSPMYQYILSGQSNLGGKSYVKVK
jgi:hypothetical protein